MVVVEMFIPTFDNDGRVFEPAIHAAWEDCLVNLFGGCSLLPGTVSGAWADGGKLYRDDLKIYAVCIPSILDGDKIRQAIDFAKSHYSQEAIFIRYLGMAEIH